MFALLLVEKKFLKLAFRQIVISMVGSSTKLFSERKRSSLHSLSTDTIIIFLTKRISLNPCERSKSGSFSEKQIRLVKITSWSSTTLGEHPEVGKIFFWLISFAKDPDR